MWDLEWEHGGNLGGMLFLGLCGVPGLTRGGPAAAAPGPGCSFSQLGFCCCYCCCRRRVAWCAGWAGRGWLWGWRREVDGGSWGCGRNGGLGGSGPHLRRPGEVGGQSCRWPGGSFCNSPRHPTRSSPPSRTPTPRWAPRSPPGPRGRGAGRWARGGTLWWFRGGSGKGGRLWGVGGLLGSGLRWMGGLGSPP